MARQFIKDLVAGVRRDALEAAAGAMTLAQARAIARAIFETGRWFAWYAPRRPPYRGWRHAASLDAVRPSETFHDSSPLACSHCKKRKRRPDQCWCRACHAAKMRASRPVHRSLAPEAKRRANARAYTNVMIQRGRLVPEPCSGCGSADVQPHHTDYSDPFAVRWLCPACHGGEHGQASVGVHGISTSCDPC